MHKPIKPFLKWVGGKSQIIDNILEHIPANIKNYYEPFLGGGSVLLNVLQIYKLNNIIISGNITASDINKDLIDLYNNIKDNINQFIYELQIIKNEYISIINLNIDYDKIKKNKLQDTKEESLLSKERYYYWVRNEYNNNTLDNIKKSAMFLFLNKTCFRGLYRCNHKTGNFNVSFGNYTNPEFFNKKKLIYISELIQDVNFIYCDFNYILDKHFEKTDFIFLDPPYVPINKTSFVDYSKFGFNNICHKTLFNKIHNSNTNIMLSNSYTEIVVNNFCKDKYTIKIISTVRKINSKIPNSRVDELLILNY